MPFVPTLGWSRIWECLRMRRIAGGQFHLIDLLAVMTIAAGLASIGRIIDALPLGTALAVSLAALLALAEWWWPVVRSSVDQRPPREEIATWQAGACQTDIDPPAGGGRHHGVC